MTSTPRWSDHQTGKRRAETSTKHPRRSQGSGAGGQWRAGPGRRGWVTTCYRCPSGQMWGRRADHWAAAREPRLLAVRAVLKEVTASSGSGERQSRGQARGQSASVAGGCAHTAHAAEGRSVSYGRSGSAQRGPPRHTSNCHPRPRHLDARSRCRAIKRERNGKETQEVNPTESRPLCKRSQSSLCRPPAVRITTKETETVRGCSPVDG